MTIQVRTLPELVDLALRTPIIGVVNFDILRTVLHILIKEMGLQNFRAKVNIRDMKPQELHMPPPPRRPSAIEQSVALEFEAEQMLDDDLDVPESEEVSWTQSKIGSQEGSEKTAPSPPAPSQDGSDKGGTRVASTQDVPAVGEEESKRAAPEEQKSSTGSEAMAEQHIYAKGGHKTTAERFFDDVPSVVSSELSVKGVEIFQEEMSEFWKSTNITSRISALESGIDKIVDIIDEQARDLEHFRRDSEKRRTKDRNFIKKIKEDFDQLIEATDGLTKKVAACLPETYFQDQMEKYITVLEEMNTQLDDIENRLNEVSEKVKGDFKMSNIIDDIIDIKAILKVPTKKQKPSRYSGGAGSFASGFPDPRRSQGMPLQRPTMGMPGRLPSMQTSASGIIVPSPRQMSVGGAGVMQQPIITQRTSSPREAILSELRKHPSDGGAARIPTSEMKKPHALIGERVVETAAITDDMKMAAVSEQVRGTVAAVDEVKASTAPAERRKVSASPEETMKISVSPEESGKLSATPEGTKKVSLPAAEKKRISGGAKDTKKLSASPEEARRTVQTDRQEQIVETPTKMSTGASGSSGRLSALAELRKSRAGSQREVMSPEGYSAYTVEYSSAQRQRVVNAEVSAEGQATFHTEEEFHELDMEFGQEEMQEGYGRYGGGYGGTEMEGRYEQTVVPTMMEREEMMSPSMQPYADTTREIPRTIEGMDIDIQQAVGAAYEFEDLQNMIENLRMKMDIIEDQNREMKRTKEEEALANEEKMAEKERLIDRLTAGMVQSSDKMGDVQHTVKMLSEKVYEVIEMVKEIGKIQDEMAEEGRKNLVSVEEQMREIFKELRKFSMLEEIQLLVEDVRHSKAERSEMLDALDRKADKSQLDCKLDKTMFETLCEEFNHGFDDLMVKISALEQHVERAVQDIYAVLEQKLEKKELDQYRDHMKDRLKAIVTKLKQMKEIIEEDPDAAGIKIRCISCDRPVRKPERNFVVSDGSLNPTLPRRSPDLTSDSAFLPPLSPDGTFRAAGGWHTLTAPPLRIKTTAGAGLPMDKAWEEVPLQGTDGRVYHGYVEKAARMASA